MSTKLQNIMMDFSGVYEEETFWREKELHKVEAKELPGTNCYCDEEAAAELRKMIAPFSAKGIHFIDSGNYHYMSRIWLEKIQIPFRLLVFDHHTDMQLPAFGGLLSCGGWIAASLMELKNLKEVILVGPDQEAYDQVEPGLKERVRFLSEEALRKKDHGQMKEFLMGMTPGLPWYLSIDKDCLCPKDANTQWSQGEISLGELLEYLDITAKVQKSRNEVLLGVDICGEKDKTEAGSSLVNDQANKRLLAFFETCFAEERARDEA